MYSGLAATALGLRTMIAGCRSGQGRPSGLLKGHPAKLLKSSRVKPSGAVFDRTKLRDMYKSEMQCEPSARPVVCLVAGTTSTMPVPFHVSGHRGPMAYIQSSRPPMSPFLCGGR